MIINSPTIDLELELKWKKVEDRIQKDFGKESTQLEAILMLIGIQELGMIKTKYTKEQKQDLMHVAVCRLLEDVGCFEFCYEDEDGWPHYKALPKMQELDKEAQENLLKRQIIAYFKI